MNNDVLRIITIGVMLLLTGTVPLATYEHCKEHCPANAEQQLDACQNITSNESAVACYQEVFSRCAEICSLGEEG